jgi:DNA-binding MarR family transcriptional regulator
VDAVTHETNVIGAMIVALSDRLREATERAAEMPASFPAALAALRMWAGDRTVDVLADGLRLSHSRAVRVVDRLEDAGLARRLPDPDDGRAVRVRLTPKGDRAADRVLAARAAALDEALSALTETEALSFSALAEAILAGVTTDRRSARGICRLCDAHACGHAEGRCPVTIAADAAAAG